MTLGDCVISDNTSVSDDPPQNGEAKGNISFGTKPPEQFSIRNVLIRTRPSSLFTGAAGSFRDGQNKQFVAVPRKHY